MAVDGGEERFWRKGQDHHALDSTPNGGAGGQEDGGFSSLDTAGDFGSMS